MEQTEQEVAHSPLIGHLVAEHRLKSRVLVLFARHCERMLQERAADIGLTRAFLRFFRQFCDGRHRAKEEKLFAWMSSLGLDQATGPLAVLHHEHDEGRELLRALAGAVNILEARPSSRSALQEVHRLALSFVELSMAHVEKEEDVLFPIAELFAVQSGTECEAPRDIPDQFSDEDEAWIQELESLSDAWPGYTLPGEDVGTAYGFARLCEESLN